MKSMQSEAEGDDVLASCGACESGDEVEEGEGSWVHWALLDRSRMDALKRQAVEKLEAKYGTERLQCDSVSSNCGESRKRRATVVLESGWKHYTSFKLDFEAGHRDSIVFDLSKRQETKKNFEAVLLLSDEFETFMTAKNIFRLALCSKERWRSRQNRPLREMMFIISESPVDQMQLYPTEAPHILIVFDKELSMQICYEYFFHLQDCDKLQKLTVTIGEVASAYQLSDFQLLLVEYLRLLVHGRSNQTKLSLTVKFPRNSRRYDALCTGHSILHQLDINVTIVWRETILSRQIIRHWAMQI